MSFIKLDELESLKPPPELTRGHGDEKFREIGRQWIETFKLYAGLSNTDHVLDVGCGPGRMALALAPVLGNSGRYEGFDIRRKDIRWCKQEIESRWPSSHFQVASLKNRAYNRWGWRSAAKFRFPYAEGSFDFVFLTSVFTHLLPDDLENYLREIVRVLRLSGRCLLTFYLINDSVREATRAGKSQFVFSHSIAPYCHVESDKNPEKAVAYDDEYVRKLLDRVGLTLRPPVHYGSWSGAQTSLPPRHGQDFVIASK